MAMRFGIAAIAVAVGLAGGSAFAEDGTYEGTWKLNVEQSHYPAMMPTIKDHVMVVSYDDGKLLQYTDNFTMGTTTSHVTFDGAESYDSRYGAHWTPAGHKLVAERLFGLLSETKLDNVTR